MQDTPLRCMSYNKPGFSSSMISLAIFWSISASSALLARQYWSSSSSGLRLLAIWSRALDQVELKSSLGITPQGGFVDERIPLARIVHGQAQDGLRQLLRRRFGGKEADHHHGNHGRDQRGDARGHVGRRGKPAEGVDHRLHVRRDELGQRR